MTRFHVTLATALAISALSTLAQPAAAIEYPWCVEYNGGDFGGGGRNCGFVSYDQCMLTARGMGGSCEPNLFYPGSATEQRRQRRKRQRER